ncbi:MAG: transcription termination factor Rho [Deltaproteobacteria bacterium]|jgi:transcription termination factor Rho
MAQTAGGILKLTKNGGGVLCDPLQPFGAKAHDIVVSPGLVRAYALVQGVMVTGSVQKHKKLPQLASIESVCGLSPEQFKKRTPYPHLVAIDPSERFQLAATGEMSMRVVDLLAPIGKGTRGLIVSPPKAGKTTLLQQMATAIRAGDPKTRILVLLIGERPEEVTYFRRAVDAEVIASSSDRSISEHVGLAELMLAHVGTELECGRDIVVLVDSLTRMGRVFNLKGRGRGRTLSGGLDAGALEIPRRFFGLARNIENGGSVTIIATALIDTGSRMDQLIFEEFKGTGNSEIVLDRGLAEARIFPSINVAASGTRKEERLYDPDDIKRLATIRRGLVDRQPKDAMISLLKALEPYPTNEEFLQGIPEDIPAPNHA